MSRGGTDKTDISSNELHIDTLATVAITSYGGGGTGLTNDPTPLITGTSGDIPAGTILTVDLDTNNDGSDDVSYTTIIANDGTWSIDTGSATPISGSFPSSGLNGPVRVTATANDPAGNSGSDIQTLTVDVTPPQITLTFNAKTSDTTPLITGYSDLPAGSTITVEIDSGNNGSWNVTTYSAIVQADGTWSVEITEVQAISAANIRATGVDSAGNTISTTKVLSIVGAAPTIAITAWGDLNASNSVDVDEDDAAVISGTVSNITNGSTVTLTLTDGNITITDSATVSGGTWSLSALNLSAMAAGPIQITASVDDSGDTYTTHQTFIHDKSAALAIDSISEDSGIIGDFTTKDSILSISGSANGGPVDTVVVKSGATAVATFSNVTVSGGTWTTGLTGTLTAGNYTIEATRGGTTVSKALTIVDAAPPTLSSSGPADGAINIAVASDITLTFNKNIQAGIGFVSLYKADGTLVESFNVATGAGDASGTIAFNGTTGITLNPHADLANSTGYYVQIESTAVMDSAGNRFAGIADDTTLNFTTVSLGGNTAPALGSIGNQNINEGSALTFTATATDSDFPADTLTYSLENGTAGNVPTGATIDSTTGAFSWTPTEAQGPGTYSFDIVVSDGTTTDRETITVTVAEVNTAPVLGSIGNKNVNEGSALTFTASATDSDLPANTLSYSLENGTSGNVPTGANIDSTTGAFSWTPTEAQGPGTYSFDIVVSDGTTTDRETITVTVAEMNTAPALGSIGNKNINEGSALSFTASATDSDLPANTLSYSLENGTSGNVPTGATINATTGAFSWTPTEAQGPGTYSFDIVVSDGTTTDRETITVTVAEMNTAPALGSIGNKNINEGSALSFTASATDSDLPANTLSYSLENGTSGSVPTGATIDATTGAFSWTPTEGQGPGTYSFDIVVSDGTTTDRETITVTVANTPAQDTTPPPPPIADTPPIISSPGLGDGAIGQPTISTVTPELHVLPTLDAIDSQAYSGGGAMFQRLSGEQPLVPIELYVLPETRNISQEIDRLGQNNLNSSFFSFGRSPLFDDTETQPPGDAEAPDAADGEQGPNGEEQPGQNGRGNRPRVSFSSQIRQAALARSVRGMATARV